MAGDDARERLIKAGLKRLHAAGYSATGIGEVVGAAGVPKGSFYYYFDSKEAFACAVVDRYAELNTRRRRALLEEAVDRPPLERLRRYFEAYAESLATQGFARGCLLGSLSAEIADHSDAVRERLIRAFADWRDMVAAVLEEAQARGDLPAGLTPAAAADFLVNGWEGALVRMKAEKSGQPLSLFIATAFDRLLAPPAPAPVPKRR